VEFKAKSKVIRGELPPLQESGTSVKVIESGIDFYTVKNLRIAPELTSAYGKLIPICFRDPPPCCPYVDHLFFSFG
jgi:hypothetical protein